MRLSRLGRVCIAGVVLAAACKESTSPGTYVPAATVNWIEWTAAVTRGQAESLRISGGVQGCGYVPVWGVTVSSMAVEVTAQVHRLNVPCLNSGTGAGYDTVLVLSQLQSQSYSLYAPVPDLISFEPTEQQVGYFDVRTAPDTTIHFAGIVSLHLDSLGCWRAQPWSASPAPRLAFAQAPPLAPALSGRRAFLVGQVVAGSPSGCGDATALSASIFEVDASP